jgi:hypothetical protein
MRKNNVPIINCVIGEKTWAEKLKKKRGKNGKSAPDARRMRRA